MSAFFLEPAHMVLTALFPGLIGLFLATKLSPHTWKFFAANIILSITSFILYAVLALGFSAQ